MSISRGAGALVFAVLAGCAADVARDQPAPQTVPAPSATAAASSAPASEPSKVDWNAEPIQTKVRPTKGCEIAGRLTGLLTLSVNGEESGVFLTGVENVLGKLTLDPSARSSAIIELGPVNLDTGLLLSRTVLGGLRNVPPVLGGILHPGHDAYFQVVAADNDHVTFSTGADALIQWVKKPTFQLRCGRLTDPEGKQPLDFEWPKGPKTVFPKSPKIAVREQQTGPVVAHITVDDSAMVLETSGKDMRIATSLLHSGVVVGWTSAGSWTETKPSPPAVEGGGTEEGPRRFGMTTCPENTRLYLLKDNRMYEVGHVQKWPASFASRNKDGRVELDLGRIGFQVKEIPWLELRDAFRITNEIWYGELGGTFFVPEGPCMEVKR